MTSKFARVLAIASSLLTLLCVLAWLVNGAPNVPVVNLISKAADVYWTNYELTWGRWMIWGIAGAATWASHAALFILASSVAAAALLSLLTLLRGTESAAIRYLGVSLGFWSLSICYLWVFSIVPTFEAFQRLPGWMRFAADSLAFELLLAATFAFILFWKEFPRPVSDEELSAFMAALSREKYRVLGPIRRTYYRVVGRAKAAGQDDVPAPAAPTQAPGRRAAGGTLKAAIAAAAVFWASLMWRGITVIDIDTTIHDPTFLVYAIIMWTLLCAYFIPYTNMFRMRSAGDPGTTSRWRGAGAWARIRRAIRIIIAVGVMGFLAWFLGALTGFICFFVVLYWPGVLCVRLFRLHRALGSVEDRRRIEWIWTALWTALVIFLIPVIVAPALSIASHWLPELSMDLGWIGVYMILAWMSGPLILIIALTLSIFYRGSIDPRLALRGITVWTVLGVVLTLVFVFAERSIALYAVGWFGLPPKTGLITASAIVAATFQPIRKRSEKYVTRFVERILPATLLASGERRILAVAVVDISGYTALSARDEQSALVASALVQKEAKRLADIHGGRMVKSTGDGAILCFKEAAACLAAIRELHRAFVSAAGTLNLPALSLHSGLHWGEVVEMHDGDIYGLTVNVTARIADWAKAGEVGTSQAFYEQLGASQTGLAPAGQQSLKNVPQPVSCYRLATI